MNRLLVKTLPAVAAILSTGVAHAQLDPAFNEFVGIQPDGAAAADFDGDGVTDLAVTADSCLNCDDVAILLGNPDGTFQAPFYVALPISSSPGGIVAGDLDGDGDNDLAVTLKDFNQVMAVMNLGGASFVQGATATTGARPEGLDIGDADNDGDLDLVVSNRDSSSVSFLLNTGSASFVSSTMASGDDVRDAGWGDFDGDGDLDAAVSSHDDRTIRIFANNGGSFSMVATLSVGGNDRPDGLDIGDLDGNGLDDIAAASGDDQVIGQNRIVLFFANGLTSFTGPQFVATNGLDTSDVAIGDLDCDFDLDLVAVNQLSDDISLLLNFGGGTFAAPTLLAAGTNPDAVIVANIQNDFDMDVVAVNRDSDDVSIYLSHCGDDVMVDLCDDINRFGARCNQTTGRIVMAVKFFDASHDGEEIIFAVDGAEFPVTITGDRAVLRLDGFAGTGEHTISVPDCGLEQIVDCG